MHAAAGGARVAGVPGLPERKISSESGLKASLCDFWDRVAANKTAKRLR